jgi:hypothetical protein
MKLLKLIFVIAAASILSALLLWVSLAGGAAEPKRYLALASFWYRALSQAHLPCTP